MAATTKSTGGGETYTQDLHTSVYGAFVPRTLRKHADSPATCDGLFVASGRAVVGCQRRPVRECECVLSNAWCVRERRACWQKVGSASLGDSLVEGAQAVAELEMDSVQADDGEYGAMGALASVR